MMRTQTGLVMLGCLVSIGFAAVGFAVAANAEAVLASDMDSFSGKSDRIEIPVDVPVSKFVTIGATDVDSQASILLRYEAPRVAGS